MKAQGPTTNIQPLNAGIHQTNRQFRIFAAPSDKRLIVTIHLHEVLFPYAQIAPTNAAQVLARSNERTRPTERVLPPLQLSLVDRPTTVLPKIVHSKKPCTPFFHQ